MNSFAAPSKAPVEYDLTQRAFEIADESMVELLRSHAVPIDDEANLYGLVDAHSCEVQTLAQADPAIVDAFDWLQRRQLAELVEDDAGTCIRLIAPQTPSA